MSMDYAGFPSSMYLSDKAKVVNAEQVAKAAKRMCPPPPERCSKCGKREFYCKCPEKESGV